MEPVRAIIVTATLTAHCAMGRPTALEASNVPPWLRSCCVLPICFLYEKCSSGRCAKLLIKLARPAGLEPATPRLGNRCSIRLSHGRLRAVPLGSRLRLARARSPAAVKSSRKATAAGIVIASIAIKTATTENHKPTRAENPPI